MNRGGYECRKKKNRQWPIDVFELVDINIPF